MRIELDIIEFTPQPHLIELFHRLLTAAAESAEVSVDSVGRVIICSESRYGPTIASIKAGSGYTNNGVGVGVGKTIPRVENGTVVSDIVLRSDIFGAFAVIPAGPLQPAAWPADVQQIYYVLCHEFGHAHDHALRKDLFDPPDPRSDAFSITATADYYGNIVLTEFAACRNAASIMTRPLFDYELQMAAERRRSLLSETNGYLEGHGDLTRRALAHVVCQAAWVFLVEVAKLYGHGRAIAELAAEAANLERGLLDETPLTDTLHDYGTAYPCWDVPTQIEQLTDIWRRYGRDLFAVEFVQRDDGSNDFEEIE